MKEKPEEPRTIENTREPDPTFLITDDAEINLDIQNDEFRDYFNKSYEPKVLITFSDNPHQVSIYLFICFYFYSTREILIVLFLV